MLSILIGGNYRRRLTHLKAAAGALHKPFAPRPRHFVARHSPPAPCAGKVQAFPPAQSLTMQLTPVITLHLSAALGALLTGPVALWARRGGTQRPRLHRAFGYAWVTLMVITATSALFIRDFALPNLAGFTPIHLLVPYVFAHLFAGFWFLARKNIAAHRKTMQSTYIGACVVAGAFTLLPGRHLGQWVWGQWLGLL